MAVLRFPSHIAVDGLLRQAIRERRTIAFVLHELPREAEPHDLGIIGGAAKLFFYQVGGRSQSARPVGWRWALLEDIKELHLLEQRFAGPRDQGVHRPAQWDVLFASVSRDGVPP